MEVTALNRLLTVLLLLAAQVDFSYSETPDIDFPQVVPNRQQHFEYESIDISCEGLEGLTGWRVMKKTKRSTQPCAPDWTSAGPCKIKAAQAFDSGEYWCDRGTERSNTVTITVTAGSVLLESPALPVMDGDAVTLRCRKRQTSSSLDAEFFKDGYVMERNTTGDLTIQSFSKTHEGRYKCSMSGAGESAESWLTVRVAAVILESPVCPVMEGDPVTLHCMNKVTTSSTAGFYKDGLFIGNTSTGKLSIHSVSKSDEGLYKCNIFGAGKSEETHLAIRECANGNMPLCSDQLLLFLFIKTLGTILGAALLLFVLLKYQPWSHRDD